ncbi:MAG: TIGR00375 family protein [Armatimonadetes bacterium]|nr:TIGR00375 family protein [Armatimonadota bacterium]
MKTYFADLHIHIGRTSEGKAVKITASRNLTFKNIIKESLERKGIQIIGVVDCASPGVLRDIKTLINEKELIEHPEGGLVHKDKVSIFLASEIETAEEKGGISHHLCFFPYLKQIISFSKIMAGYISNIELSSQRAILPAGELLAVVKSQGGILIPAHAFTPHKSLYGNAASSLGELFKDLKSEITALELGLSADTYLADYLSELREITFLSNSDAHSLAKIAREYNLIKLEKPTFKEFVLALHRQEGRKISANFGLDPKLGKYHRSFCERCNLIIKDPPPVKICPKCHTNNKFVKGVLDRIIEISDQKESISPLHRPHYQYQIPLEFIPGAGKVILNRLINYFGGEMAVLHKAEREELTKIAGWKIAEMLILAREGKLKLSPGGGGHYGKVSGVKEENQQLNFNLV